MTDGEKLFLKCGTVILATIILSVTSCMGYRSHLIGTSPRPLETACALGDNINSCVAAGAQGEIE